MGEGAAAHPVLSTAPQAPPRRRPEPSAVPPARSGAALARVPARVRHWILDAVYGGLVVLLAPYALGRYLRQEKTRARWRAYAKDLPERFRRRRRRASDAPCIWVHGVSVGEVKAAARLVEALEREVPGLETVLTVSTDTARRVAHERYGDRRVDFYPPDLSWIVQNALDRLRPDLVLLVESELWPNFLSAAYARRIPVVLVNGRMSERSCRRFCRVRPLARELLGGLAAVCVQIDAYAERFAAVGVDPARIHVTGNMKLDNVPFRAESALPTRIGALDLADGRPLVVAGSTHPGEERALARIARRLAERGRPFRLLLAPRHPARADAVEADVRREGLDVVRRSRLEAGASVPPAAVVLLDTVGELEGAYALAHAAFVGGTLVRHGGQNVMEPASLGKPTVIGPSYVNFRGEVEMLEQAGGLVVAPDEAGVSATLEGWLESPAAAAEVGRRAKEAVRASKGATTRTVEVLRPWLAAIVRRDR